MKSYILKSMWIMVMVLMVSVQAYAAEVAKTPVRIIYINGSNNNTEKDRFVFSDGMKKIHNCVKKDFESSDYVKKNMLDNGQDYILDNPRIFFWGYSSNSALNNVNEDLVTLDMISTKMAQSVRKMIAHVMHDAIWVQKERNMQIVVNNLHKEVMAANQRGEKVILFGHSAGSFVTYRYMFHKLPAISADKVYSYLERNKIANASFFKAHPVKNTCLDAVTESGLGVSTSTGEFVLNPNPAMLKEAYLKLNDYTATECVPDNELMGVVNFGSPLALFYSDIGTNTENYDMNLYRYIKNNNMFFITDNFADDPIGFPLSRNLSAQEMENLYNIGFNPNGKGFTYSKSDVNSPATFVGAHCSYWKCPNKFAKSVVKAYSDGYKNFYPAL